MEKINFSVLACLTINLALISRMDFDNLGHLDYAVIFTACLLVATMFFRLILAYKES